MTSKLCGSSAPTKEDLQGKFKYTVTVNSPKTSEAHIFELVHDNSELLFESLMMLLNLDETLGDLFDANFIALYNTELDRFEHYVQCLVGTEITSNTRPNTGEVWVPFINKQRHDWHRLVTSMCLVKHSDTILWKYQKDNMTEAQSFNEALTLN